MKKLMFALTAGMLACAAQAAATWSANLAFNTTADYDGYTVWAVNFWNPYRVKGLPTSDGPSVGYGSTCNNGLDYASLLANATTPEAQISTLNSAKTGDNALFVNNFKTTFSTVADDTSSITVNSDNIMYSWLFVLVKDLDASGNATYRTKYAVIRAPEQSPQVTGEVTSPTYHPGEATKSGGYTITISDSNVMTSGVVAIPEPTSGLLLLLGFAGLALRRKRA